MGATVAGRSIRGHHVQANGGHHRPSVHRQQRLVTGRGARRQTNGLRYPADPPTVEQIIVVMREAGPGPYADTTRGLRGGLEHSVASSPLLNPRYRQKLWTPWPLPTAPSLSPRDGGTTTIYAVFTIACCRSSHSMA